MTHNPKPPPDDYSLILLIVGLPFGGLALYLGLILLGKALG